MRNNNQRVHVGMIKAVNTRRIKNDIIGRIPPLVYLIVISALFANENVSLRLTFTEIRCSTEIKLNSL